MQCAQCTKVSLTSFGPHGRHKAWNYTLTNIFTSIYDALWKLQCINHGPYTMNTEGMQSWWYGWTFGNRNYLYSGKAVIQPSKTNLLLLRNFIHSRFVYWVSVWSSIETRLVFYFKGLNSILGLKEFLFIIIFFNMLWSVLYLGANL